ncbi:hypothetical protein I550_4763 [Mycobacterium intracellulare 1956]|uniref:Uncharacterized protein n=1 Tax=Mycobacterium intracellulare 1956 TaxID=1299331 RepID=X8CBF6_MYCIT|nr:hypothetical protein I550_4763 [Mycobacterium intracellulare 1956]
MPRMPMPWIGAWMGWRPRCVPMTHGLGSSAALMHWGRWPPTPIGWGVAAGARIVRPGAGRGR